MKTLLILVLFFIGCSKKDKELSEIEQLKKDCQNKMDKFFVCVESEVKKDCSALQKRKADQSLKKQFRAGIDQACKVSEMWKVCNEHNPPYKSSYFKRHKAHLETAYKTCGLE